LALPQDGQNQYNFTVQAGDEALQSLTVVSNSATQIDATNWACVKSTTDDYVIVQANLSDTNAAALANAATAIQWTGGQPVPGNPLQREVSKTNSVETTVTASLGGSSTNLNVWVIWATVSIQMSGTNPSPLSFEVGYHGSSVSNQLGVQYYSYNTNDGSLTPTSITNSDSILGKICVEATITPSGVANVVDDNWNVVQMRQSEEFVDGELQGVSNLNWDNDDIDPLFIWTNPDPNLYLIDSPGIVHATGIATNSIQKYANFYDEVIWNSQLCSNTNNFWHFQATWNFNQNPRFTNVDLGTNTINLP
jgi:hypothetical protein